MEILPINHHHHHHHQNKTNKWYCGPCGDQDNLSSLNNNNNDDNNNSPPPPQIVLNLSKRLEEEIRKAKRTHLSCGEVLLPNGLLQRIAENILLIADKQLYGLNGCTLYLLYEGEEDCRRLSHFKIDPTTPSTYEIYLTFKQANAGWTFLPQFLKKITRGGTVVISNEFELTKKKLYRIVANDLKK